jgi:catechol 2,3-dioxygenase-like lactoylglutathione lyase family enzyme
VTVPFEIEDIDHVVLRVVDIDRSMAFYRDVLGCGVDKVQEAIGLYQMRAGNALIDLVPVDGKLGSAGGAPAGREGRNVDHFCLVVSPFDEPALRAHLARHGVEANEVGRSYGARGYGLSLYVRDPDGNTVELRSPHGEAS